MFSITSMVMPGPFGGHCQTSWPLYMVPIGEVRLGGVRGEILQRVQPADAAQRLDHVVGDLAGVERVAAVPGDRAQRLAEFRLMDHVAGHRRLAVRQQIALGVGAVLQLLELVLPVEGDARRDDIAFLGGLDRGLQQACRSPILP